MKVHIDELDSNLQCVIWGAGNYLNQAIMRIDPQIHVLFVCDSDAGKWGTKVTDKNYSCVSPEILKQYQNIVVLIAVNRKPAIREICQELDRQEIPWCHINEAILKYREKYESVQIEKYDQTIGQRKEPADPHLLRCFISISVPVQACQLKCGYCYIGQNGGYQNENFVLPSAEFICKALSRKRLGGTALINFCGAGETLLCRDLVDIIQELLAEGHYISIITNALLTEEINKYLLFPSDLRQRIFFKCSFHYRQLKEKKLMETYVENVNRIKKSGMSISVELVPEDEIIPFIPEIMKFSLEHFGALPHVTVTRDEGKEDMPILTRYNIEEYKRIWGQFDSDMFSFKMNQMVKRKEYCTAGKNTFMFSLESGNIAPCPQEKVFFNIYNDISQNIDVKEVGYACSNSYCRNGHAYLTLGMVKEVNSGNYLQMRDRVAQDGTHWVNECMARIFKQRICDNEQR